MIPSRNHREIALKYIRNAPPIDLIELAQELNIQMCSVLENYRHAIAGIAYMVDASARRALFRKEFIRIHLPERAEKLFLYPTEATILQDLLEHTARFSNNEYGVGGSISIDIGQTGHERINDIGWANKLLPKTYQDLLLSTS